LLTLSRFSLKFQKIVQDEQDANFITRLHAGKLQIIPWPVIESREFYKLFAALKRKLDQQPTSHHTAGEFLHTLKTLMAKLKVCLPSCLFFLLFTDWLYSFLTGKRLGSHVTCVPRSDICSRLEISALETMAAHRANSLLAILPNALETGLSEVSPEREPLKVCPNLWLLRTKLKTTEL
jgi:hypothetical protein